MFLAQQWGLSYHAATATVKWNKQVNKVVMECFYRSKSFREEGKPILGSRKTIFTEGKERGMSESMEQLENTVEGES